MSRHGRAQEALAMLFEYDGGHQDGMVDGPVKKAGITYRQWDSITEEIIDTLDPVLSYITGGPNPSQAQRLVEKIRDVVERQFGNDADAVKGFDEIAVLLTATGEPSAPVYGVEVTYQSGRIGVRGVYDEPSWAEMLCRMLLSTGIGRVDEEDGIVGVRVVTSRPVWEAYEPPEIEVSAEPSTTRAEVQDGILKAFGFEREDIGL